MLDIVMIVPVFEAGITYNFAFPQAKLGADLTLGALARR